MTSNEQIRQWIEQADEVRCGTCYFYDGDGCRRKPPAFRSPNEFNLIAMLQAIALAQVKMADIPKKGVDQDVYKEVTEHYTPERWPPVDEYDWCGEWTTGYDEEIQAVKRGLRNVGYGARQKAKKEERQ